MKTLRNQQGTLLFEVALVVLVLAAVGAAAYFAYQARQTDKVSTDISVSATTREKSSVKSKVKATYDYWINNKEIDYSVAFNRRFITQRVVDQSKAGLNYDLISCSQSTLKSSSDYTYGEPTLSGSQAATMIVSGTYEGDATIKGDETTLKITLDLIKIDNDWQIDKVTCPKM